MHLTCYFVAVLLSKVHVEMTQKETACVGECCFLSSNLAPDRVLGFAGILAFLFILTLFLFLLQTSNLILDSSRPQQHLLD